MLHHQKCFIPFVKANSKILTLFFQGNTSEPWYLLGINIAGGVCISLWAIFWSFCIFFPLSYFNFLRIKPQTEYKGVDVMEHGESAYPVDAWVEIQYNQNKEGDRPKVPSVMQGPEE